MQQEVKNQALGKLKKARGMIDKVVSMVEDNRYCIDVVQQSLAAIGFLKSVNKVVLEGHLNTCFREGMSATKAKQDQLISEIMRIVNKCDT